MTPKIVNTRMSKSRSSHEWHKTQERDEFVRRARAEGFRSRASYKLIEIADKYRLFRPGMTVVDLGAAPGGWSQVAATRVGAKGSVIAVDLLEMKPINGVTFIQGDVLADATLDRLLAATGSCAVDLVLSDMAPNMSGMKAIDQPRATLLVELAVELAQRVLRSEGALVAKCFEGEGIGEIRALMRQKFTKVMNFKPKSSRDKSREIYVIGCGYKAVVPE